jgi:membrane-associated phospholipid phosphatase
MQEQAGKEDQGKFADCGYQIGDSKIGTRETQTGNLCVKMIARFRWWWSLLVLVAGLLMVAGFYFDGAVQAWIAQHQDDGARKFMRGAGQFGDWPGHITLGLVLLVLAYWRRSKNWMRIFAAMILACALAGAGARVVKIAAGRARPSVETEAAWKGPSLSARYNAFPSGHTAASTAFFATLALACWRIGVPFLIIPLLIGFSRMYLGAHFLSDVVCASLIGLLSAYVVAQWLLGEVPNQKPQG